MMRSLTTKEMFIAVAFAMLVFSAVPFIGSAQTNIDEVADKMCNPVKVGECFCGMFKDPQTGQCTKPGNMWQCPCQGTKTSGICTASNKCKATSFKSESGQKGGTPGMEQLMSALKGLMDALKGGAPPPPPPPPMGGGGSGSYPSGSFPQGCTTYYQTSVQGNTDPCSYYVPDYSQPGGDDDVVTTPDGDNATSGCSSFSETTNPDDGDPCTFYIPALPAGSTPNGNDDCTTFTRTTDPEDKRPCILYVGVDTKTGKGTTPSQASPPSFFGGFLHGVVGMQGFQGDVREDVESGTVFGGIYDRQGNTGFGSFVGSRGTIGGSSLGIVGRLCVSRPWVNTFVSFLIKPSFFDNLCTSRGYQLGAPSATQDGPIGGYGQVSAPKKASTTTPPAPPPRSYIPPQADIWAVPSAVAIGARTSVFWNTRGVVECLVSSPDGNFNETSLSGAASTVPIVSPVEFTIKCKSSDGTEVKNSVVVTLKI